MKKNIFILMLVITFLFPVTLQAAVPAYHPHEPKVTQQEAKILDEVHKLMAEDKQDEALRYLNAQITKETNAALDFVQGTIYYTSDRKPEAEKAFRAALQKFPSFSRARANLATLLLQQERTDEAFRELKTVLLEGTASGQVLTMTGYIYLLKGDPVAAESAYRQAILHDNEDKNAYMGLAKSLVQQSRQDEVIGMVQTLLAKDASRGEFWTLLGNAYVAQNNYEQAVTALESGRRLGVLDAESLAMLGDLYMNVQMPENALPVYQESFALREPAVNRLLRIVSGFLSLQRPAEASPLLERAVTLMEKRPKDITREEKEKIYWLKARHAQLSGQDETARKGLLEVLDMVPQHGDALMALGDWYRDHDQLEQALIYYERAGRTESKEVASLLRQAQIYVTREQYAKAVELLEHAQVLSPSAHVGRYLEQVRRILR